MSSKKNISRQDFIKGLSSTVGLLALGVNTVRGNDGDSIYPAHQPDEKLNPHTTATRRGSWLAKLDNKKPGDLILVNKLLKCTIVVEDTGHTAIKQSALFLSSDIETITGYKPAIVNAVTTQNQPLIRIATLGNSSVPKDITQKLQGSHEAYIIRSVNNELWLVGADFRGAAFAVYCLAERLGIDPLYHWTNYRPQAQSELIVKSIDHYSPPPVFKYRGFFHDDEDILPRPFERSGYPLRIGDVGMDWYKRYFETTLRLGMNMTAPVCRVRRRYEIQKCASDWGLFYTSHHYDILLSNPFGIERFRLAEKRGVSTDWDWFKNKENMIRYWRGGVEENKDINCVWPVGLRGTDDHAYEFPPNTPADVQATVFKDAINKQVDTVKAVTQGKKALFHFTMYTEMLEKYRQHPESFEVPKDVTIVWPDNDDGLMRALPTEKDKWRHGVYYHLAYLGKNVSKQGPHVISPARIATEFNKIIKAGATEFLLVNVSEMREHVMEMRMIAEICSGQLAADEPLADERFINWWGNEYFGNINASLKQRIYAKYFAIFNSSELVWQGTDMVQDLLKALSAKIKGNAFDVPDTKRIAALSEKIVAYESVFADIEAVQQGLWPAQRQFFYENITLGLLIDYRPSQAATLVLKALNAKTASVRWQYINEAITPLEKLEIELLKGERTPFEKWYGETWIKNAASPLNYHRAYKQLREFINTGGNLPVIEKGPGGHNIEGAKLWNDYLEGNEKIITVY